VPGHSLSRALWGDLPLLVDTSAWSRAHYPSIREQWTEALRTDRLRISPAARLEILFAARDGETFDELAEELSLLRTAPLTPATLRAAETAMGALAQRSAGAHRVPIVDYLIAASAQESGSAVIHYNHDYDLLAEIMIFDSVWLSSAGSLP
jgi:predicted nucleic acid-binding protein